MAEEQVPEVEGEEASDKPGQKGFLGGLPPAEIRRIRAKARRYADGHFDEFIGEAKVRMFEHTLKLEAMARYAEDSNAASALAASYRKAVADVVAAFSPKAKK